MVIPETPALILSKQQKKKAVCSDIAHNSMCRSC